MASSLTDIRDALKQTISQFGLQVYGTVPDVTNTPACVIEPDTIDYTVAMAMGGDTYVFRLMVLVAATELSNAQKKLDQYITGQGEKSIRQFLFENSSLGLPDVDCVVKSMKGYNGAPESAGIKLIGAIMRVSVTVT